MADVVTTDLTRHPDRRLRRAAQAAEAPHGHTLAYVGAAGGGGLLLWYLLTHKGHSALPTPLPCPAGWTQAPDGSCAPPGWNPAAPAVVPLSGADLALFAARMSVRGRYSASQQDLQQLAANGVRYGLTAGTVDYLDAVTLQQFGTEP